MKSFSTLLFIFFIAPFYAQIGMSLSPGKYNKKYLVIDRGEQYYAELLKKPIKGTKLHEPWNYNPRLDTGITIHQSRSVKGAITGKSYQGEYMYYQPFKQRKEGVNPDSYISLKPVTNKDWREFQAYVADSIARRILAEEFPNEFLVRPTEEDRVETDVYEWNINWKVKSKFWNKVDYSPLLSQMYYYENERYYNKKELDTRKLIFEYYWVHLPVKNRIKSSAIRDADNPKFIIRERIATFHDSTYWKQQGEDDVWVGDIYDNMVSFYQHHEQFEDDPVVCINTAQANAFLAWKTQMHQTTLNRKKIPLRVEYRLPNNKEIKQASPKWYTYTVPEFDLSQWQITNKDYQEYVHYVRDSITRRILGEEYPEEFLVPTYGDEYEERDPVEWDLNWGAKLDWSKLPDKYKEKLSYLFTENDSGFENNIDPRKLIYLQYYYDYEEACKLDTSLYSPVYTQETGYNRSNKREGKDLFLGYENDLKIDSDVRSDISRDSYIVPEKINVYPGIICSVNPKCCENHVPRSECICDECNFDHLPKVYDFSSAPKSLITDLKYTQARSYYLWKIRHKGEVVKHENVLIANYIPSQQEWKKLQAGKRVLHPEQVLKAPTPTFRYVVKFYPRTL